MALARERVDQGYVTLAAELFQDTVASLGQRAERYVGVGGWGWGLAVGVAGGGAGGGGEGKSEDKTGQGEESCVTY